MADATPSYFYIEPCVFDTWVSVLGPAAAGKLMAACCGYFFHGIEPDAYKLPKAARAMFDGERAKLDRRRASALNGAKSGKGCKGASVGDENQPNTDVEKSVSRKEVSKISPKSSGKVAEKSPKNRTVAHASTCENEKSRLAPIINLNLSNIPQTPTAKGKAVGSGVMSRDEYERLMAGGLGFGSPTVYGMGGAAVVGG